MASPHDPISRIESATAKSTDEVQKTQTDDLQAAKGANKDYFDSLMSQERNKEQLQLDAQANTQKTSLIDEVRELHNKVDGWRIKMDPQDLVVEARNTIAQVEEIKSQLATDALQLRDPVQRLLERKLTHIDDNLKVALDRAGIEYKEVVPLKVLEGNEPLERFLGMLTGSQNKLDTLSGQIANVNRDEINPMDLLAIQIKVNYVQQELEFFTNLLNKSLESTKTIMNVQV